MVNIYDFFLNNKKKSGTYNASAGNLSALDTASEIKKIIPDCKINIESSNDPRSYRLSNEKIIKAGYKFHVNLTNGIQEFIDYYRMGKIRNTPNTYSINFINKIKKI